VSGGDDFAKCNFVGKLSLSPQVAHFPVVKPFELGPATGSHSKASQSLGFHMWRNFPIEIVPIADSLFLGWAEPTGYPGYPAGGCLCDPGRQKISPPRKG